MTDEQQIAPLQEEIRHAGRAVSWLRAGIIAAAAAIGVLHQVPDIQYILSLPFDNTFIHVTDVIDVVAPGFWVGITAGAAVAFPIAAAYRRSRLGWIRDALISAPAGARAALLEPLRHAAGDAGAIARRLLRERSDRPSLPAPESGGQPQPSGLSAPLGEAGSLADASASGGAPLALLDATSAKIRRAGSVTRRLRMVLFGALALSQVAWVTWDFWASGGRWGAVLTLEYAWVGVTLSFVVALPFAAAFRCWQRRRVRRQLASLPRAESTRIVHALRFDGGDTRKLLPPLMRDTNFSGELAPAAAPGARGDEPSPAETAP